MKKTIALALALMIAVVSLCTITAFATGTSGDTAGATSTTAESTTEKKETTTEKKETTTEKKETTTEKKETTTADPDAPNDSINKTTTKKETTTAKETTTGKETTTAKETTTGKDATTEVAPTSSLTTSFDDGDPTTTKKPAAVDGTIPNTGSGIVVPAIALLAIAASSAIVIKSKKED